MTAMASLRVMAAALVLGAACLGAAQEAQAQGAPVAQEEPSLDQRYKAVEERRKAARLLPEMQSIIADYQALADAGHARSAFRLGNIFYRGTLVPADPARGTDRYRQAAELGMDDAWRYLGNALLAQDRGEAALEAFGNASKAGVTGWELSAAKAHLTRRFGTRSAPAEGLAMLQTLADGGDDKARMELAKVRANASSGFADFDAARALLEEMAQSGDAEALSRLARLYRSGLGVPRDYARANALYLQAAAAGQGGALLSAAEMEMRRGLYSRARTTLNKAMEADVEGAALALAEAELRRNLGSRSDPAAGTALIRDGLDRQDLDFALLALDLMGDRLTPGVPAPEVLEMVERAADTGSSQAALALIRVSRERPRLVPGLGARRVPWLTKYSDQLPEEARIEEEIRLLVAVNAPAKARRLVQQRVAQADAALVDVTLVAAWRADRNVYIHAVQAELTRLGMYAGRLNGRLTGATLGAMLRFCRQEGFAEQCQHGPLGGTAVRLVSAALAARR
ncbi:tetratricopeptide repeat protein [Tropicibacter naphthalenivorans]|uniref:Sel1 repeat n=1 Tax=Tropicibacter naphthalenivorans TaxID=441103 RepID=A0A0P1H0Q2_9RHOB|nr:sel1 repeat family protein [Tropicibacter naphthalenivorans]CUH82680.1 Sel1 repeat [Tropicibacter naphthalenivorans]SMD11127.1 hypothetical protein SAMN04488093_1254 [Tropicibacter naphthalenivorans]